MSEIQNVSSLKPVPFDNGFRGLTLGQRNIMEMLTKHLSENKPITRDDIALCYIKSVAPTGVKKRWGMHLIDGRYQYAKIEVVLTKDEWSVTSSSLSWFKKNLGSCIIKGKIMAIPVIDINQEK